MGGRKCNQWMPFLCLMLQWHLCFSCYACCKGYRLGLALTKYNVIWISCFCFMGHVYARDMYISFIMQLNMLKCLSWCYVNICGCITKPVSYNIYVLCCQFEITYAKMFGIAMYVAVLYSIVTRSDMAHHVASRGFWNHMGAFHLAACICISTGD